MKLKSFSGVKVAPILESGWRRISEGAKLIVEKIRSKHINEPKVTKHDRLKMLMERVDHEAAHTGNGMMPEATQKDFQAQVRSIAAQGFNDGVAGQSCPHIELNLTAIATDLLRRMLGEVALQEGKDAIEVASKQYVVHDKLVQVRLHQDYQNYLQHHSKFNERGNTIGEFVLYLICSLLIFVADIPLAADMLKWLMYPGDANNKPFSIINWHDESNLKPLITAIGIGLSTIFIKVWYDKFVGKKYGHSVIVKKKLEELFDPAYKTIGATTSQRADDKSQGPERSPKQDDRKLNEQELRAIKKNELIIRIIELILLSLTIGTVIMLGIFRGAVRSLGGDTLQDIPLEITAPTLILITLLFSVVSGVCLSIALSALTNYRRLRKSKHEEMSLEQAYLAASRELAVLEGRANANKQFSQQMASQDNWIKTAAQLLKSHYDAGFREGRMEPGYYMQELDFFDRIIAWRDQQIARTINAHHSKTPINENQSSTAIDPA